MTDTRGEKMVTFGGTVADIRKQAHLTQEALANKAGISRNYLSQIERNKANMTLDILCRLAKALGVEAWVLMTAYQQAQGG